MLLFGPLVLFVFALGIMAAGLSLPLPKSPEKNTLER